MIKDLGSIPRQGRGQRGAKSTRAGAARAALASWLLVLLGALLVGWFALVPVETEVAPAALPPTPEATPALENPEATRVASGLGVEGPRPLPAYPKELADPTRFVGFGRIEAHLSAPSGITPPTHWTLVLEPAPFKIGAEHARARRIEVRGGLSLVADDVALGSYTARAEAGDFECKPIDLELRKPELIDIVFPLELYERGTLTGRIVDDLGLPVRGMPVFALSRAGKAERETRTGPDGVYAFERLPDGDWRIRVATREQPLVSAEDVTFAAPSLHLRDFRVPRVGSIQVQVVDELGVGLVGTLVEALGSRAGPLSVTTGPDGFAELGPAIAGEVRLFATDARAGQAETRLTFDPTADNPTPIQLRLRP
ncbi:MAG: carboxypeptidase regulatory-like domain-containing protein [Planctomycetes bacterium]|nr:carboxypeptidase regulatory-like domain-containing protein [Planctomycetota bacterium]MBM3991978.1 carboxypeptidase regulatory-like domain-containing protein [Planctomycetota bacterium]